jgi:hypothetical protein
MTAYWLAGGDRQVPGCDACLVPELLRCFSAMRFPYRSSPPTCANRCACLLMNSAGGLRLYGSLDNGVLARVALTLVLGLYRMIHV